MWIRSDPRIQIYQREGAYAVFLRYLNKFCLNKSKNDKAGSIYIKWKNKLPVIGFFFIIFIFLAINFNSAYSDWLWEVGKQELKTEAWCIEQSHGSRSEAASLKPASVKGAHTGTDNEVESILGKCGLTTAEMLSSLVIVLVHFNHIALNSSLSTMSMYLPPTQVKCNK